MSKKIVIPKEQLPTLIAGETDCFIRFRLRTADLGRFSAWTPIYPVTPTVAWTNAIEVLQSDVATLQTDVNTAESNITTLQGNVTTINSNITTLNTKTDDNFAISVVL